MTDAVLEQLDALAARHGQSRREVAERLLERAISSGLLAEPTPSAPKEGFVGSTLPGHRDVPELGWYRPTSKEARAGIQPLPPFDARVRRGAAPAGESRPG